jgi:hypothetical protein
MSHGYLLNKPGKRGQGRTSWQLVLLLAALLLGGVAAPQQTSTRAAAPQAVQAPILKWQRGGCYTSWCETGWYSSPAVADLDGDGTMEVIGAAYTLFVLNGEDGEEQWHVDPPVSGARVWPGVVVADIDGDDDLEIVTAHGHGYVRVLNHLGNPVWTQHPASNEFRSLAVADLDDDGDMEIVVGLARLNRVNAWVFEHTGSIRAGTRTGHPLRHHHYLHLRAGRQPPLDARNVPRPSRPRYGSLGRGAGLR